MNFPIVSIICPAYNHEKFIAEALNGFIRQKTTFTYEIIVHDDASTDNTAEIVKEFEAKFPNLFSNIYQIENQFSKSANNVMKITFAAAKGKYIALCEGDDYWCDENKLQQQIEFLESHPRYSGCFHNTEERYEDGDKASFLYCNYSFAQNITFFDLSYGNVIPTCSAIFRNNLIGGFPEWFHTLKMGDWPLHLLNSQFGDFWYIPKVMGVHRLHSKSIWMLQDGARNNQFIMDAYDVMIKGFDYNETYSGNLVKAKESINQKWGYKKRIKNFIIKIIEKA